MILDNNSCCRDATNIFIETNQMGEIIEQLFGLRFTKIPLTWRNEIFSTYSEIRETITRTELGIKIGD